MRNIKHSTWWLFLVVCLSDGVMHGAEAVNSPAESKAEDGVALAMVFDTSGSMRDAVPDSQGKMSPKYVIAGRALESVVAKLQAFKEKQPGKKLQTSLIVFKTDRPAEVVPFGEFTPEPYRKWIANNSPNGATPLGQALQLGAQTVLKSRLTQKHVLIITDGENTQGPKPEDVLPKLLKEAENKNVFMFVHFVAFDVDSRVFAPVKKQGATVVGAVNEKQLNDQLEFIIEQKILLEK